MAKKQFFLIVDTETTIDDTVCDFGAVVVDKQGNIHDQLAVLVKGHFDQKELFHDKQKAGLWGTESLKRRRANYNQMLNNGTRVLATVQAINNWLVDVRIKYDPELTAYNLAFDTEKCFKTGIVLEHFQKRFCLWYAAVGNICHQKKYRTFVVENHLFNAPTELGNMSYQTNAEAVAGYLADNMTKEPHTALEDAIDYELPILHHIVNKKNWRDNIKAYNWRNFQVRDWFIAK